MSNLANYNKTLDLLRSGEGRFDMTQWLEDMRTGNTPKTRPTHWCNTTGCIAGYVIMACADDEQWQELIKGTSAYSTLAARLLGEEPNDEMYGLFYGFYGGLSVITREHAITALETIRDGRKVDWAKIIGDVK